MQAGLAGEPLKASVRDILDEHADTMRRADEERQAEEADRERAARRKAEEERSAMRHMGNERRLRPRRALEVRDRAEERGGESVQTIDPRLLLGGAVLGVILAGGIRRLILLGAVAAGAWALYHRVLEPARDPGVVLQ